MLTYPSIQILIAPETYIEFSRQQVIEAVVVDQVHAAGIEMPVSTLEFKVIQTGTALSMFNGDLYDQLTERLPVFCYEFVQDTQILIGKFYLDTWKNISAYEMEFTAVDVIGILADTDFDGIFWGEDVTLAQAFTQVFASINIAYEIDPSLIDAPLSGWIAPGKYRDALQQMCFATGAMAITSRTEKLKIMPTGIPVSYYLTRIRHKDAKQLSMELLPLVASIELVSHDYSQSLTEETIFEKTLPAGEHKIVFDKPYYNIVIDGLGYVPLVLATEGGDYLATENGDYLEAGGEYSFGTNSVYISLSAPATIVITGIPWIDSKRSFLFNEEGVTATKNKITLSIANATLVNLARAQTILDLVRDYYRQRYIQKLLVLPTTIKTGDIILSNTFELQRILSVVKSMTMNLTGGFLSQMELRGYLPPYILPDPLPVRRARTGLAVTGSDMTHNNQWRLYA